jgi:ketosteroid isomerase-like protein
VAVLTRERLGEWIAGYEHAWREPGTDRLAEIFSADATYSTAPYQEPHRGLEAIAAMWEEERSPGEQFTIESEIVAVEGETGVVRVHVEYEQPKRQQYRDLWIRAGRPPAAAGSEGQPTMLFGTFSSASRAAARPASRA